MIPLTEVSHILQIQRQKAITRCRGSWRNIGLWGDNKAAAEHQLVMAAQFCECPENHSIAHFELRGPSVKICLVTSLWWYWEVMAGPSERK